VIGRGPRRLVLPPRPLAASGAGYDIGYAAGYADGEAAGYADGEAAGEAAGYADGYAAGYADGLAAGALEPVDWVQITTTEEGSSPVDTDGMASSASHSAGVFTATTNAAFAGIVDGYRENVLMWSKRVLDVFPTFDPVSSVIELAVVSSAGYASAAAAHRYGIYAGLLSRSAANRAAGDGVCGYLRVENTTPTLQVTHMARSAISGGTQGFTSIDGFMTRILGWKSSGNVWNGYGVTGVRQAGSTDYENGLSAQTGGSVSLADGSLNWHFVTGLAKSNATVGAHTFTWQMWARHLHTTGVQ